LATRRTRNGHQLQYSDLSPRQTAERSNNGN